MVAGVAKDSLIVFLTVFALGTALAVPAGALGGGLAVALVAVPLRHPSQRARQPRALRPPRPVDGRDARQRAARARRSAR